MAFNYSFYKKGAGIGVSKGVSLGIFRSQREKRLSVLRVFPRVSFHLVQLQPAFAKRKETSSTVTSLTASSFFQSSLRQNN